MDIKYNKGFSALIALLIVGILTLGVVIYLKNNQAKAPSNLSFNSNDLNSEVPINTTPVNSTLIEDLQNENQPPSTPIVSTDLPEPYISAQDNWPPIIENSSVGYTCSNSTSAMSTTISRMVNGRTFCVTTMSEGAAGSTFKTMTYVVANGTGIKSTNFTLRYVNCGAYEEPQLSECNSAKSGFNLDDIVESLI